MPKETEELVSIQKQREMIEKLVAFSQQLARIVNTMESVQHMMRPSQIPKQRQFALLHQLIDRMQTMETEQLYTRLQTLDTEVEKEIKKILALSQLKEDDLEKKYADKSRSEIATSHKTLLKELKDFSRKAQTNVAIRYSLHSRGCSLDTAKLPFSQEELAIRVQDLKSKEHECRNKLTQHIESLINDTKIVLNTPQFPDDLKEQIAQVKTNLEKNLEHIKNGDDIEGLPVFIESLEIISTGDLDSTPVNDDSETSMATDAIEHDKSNGPKNKTNAPEIISSPNSPSLEDLQAQYRQKGVLGRLWMWLNTPFGVTWKDISKPPED
ncbi:MAG: hypothetical protein KUG82_17495 [Pseudomonadales bacterium]|nr:hypothetical protein [Pseudomonadales bacterium]